MSAKQTAIEWLENQEDIQNMINVYSPDAQLFLRIIFNQAKAMEKEQHSNTWNHGSYSLLDHGSGEDFEQYFNKTYEK